MALNTWSEVKNVRIFNKLGIKEQQRILDMLLDKKVVDEYYFDYLVYEIKDFIDNNTFYKIGINLLLNGKPNTMRGRYVKDIVKKMSEIDTVKTRKILLNSESLLLNKILLTLDNLALEEEVKGLRALSNSKIVPQEIHIRKYQPRLDALKQLPPVMRLKTLEALTNVNKLKYNIFEKFSEDDFKALLFTSSLKHNDRVQTVYNRYSELKYMGIESTIQVSGNCDFCGSYTIDLTSKVIRTITGLNGTNLAFIARPYCLFCYSQLKQDPTFKG